VAVVKADDQQSADEAIQKAENLVSSPTPKTEQDKGNRKALTIDKAILKLNGADLCLISVAGKYAAAEADKALNLGLHVMLFSDNVSLEDELALKTKAVEKGLLMMGPDCGTAIINGTPLAFANHIPHGKLGIVSASGTGLQEISATIANLGGGISQAFGTGGRDGMKEIGGLMLYGCLEYLINDPETEVIVLMGKTPAPDVLSKLWKLLSQTAKPVIINFLKPMEIPSRSNLQYTLSLAETARLACLAQEYRQIPIS
jgi:FdrA protein